MPAFLRASEEANRADEEETPAAALVSEQKQSLQKMPQDDEEEDVTTKVVVAEEEPENDFEDDESLVSESESERSELDSPWEKAESLAAAEHRELLVEELVWRGVPRGRRRREWLRLSGADALAQREGLENALSAPPLLLLKDDELAQLLPTRIRADIEVDVPRAGARGIDARRRLKRVLLALAARQPVTMGYCQGLNVIAATTLKGLGGNDARDEYAAYWLLAVLTEERCKGWWDADFAALRHDVSELCMRAATPDDEASDWTRVRRVWTATTTTTPLTREAHNSSDSEKRTTPAQRARLATRRLVEEIGAPLDLVMSQWLLTIFGHAGGQMAPRSIRLRALDVAYCAPTALPAALGKRPGAAALLALALAVVAAADLGAHVRDLVEASRSLEQALMGADAADGLFDILSQIYCTA